MILTIDIGNTHIVLGGVEGDEIVFQARLRTEATKTSDQYAVDIRILMEIYGIKAESIEGAIISSSAPQALNPVQSAVVRLTGKKALIVGPGIKTGVNILLENPSQIGADMVVADAAALDKYKAPMIIIDMGTATTFSVLDEKGGHLGGCIIPGVKISLDALTSHTSLLPGLQLTSPKNAIGRNTVEAMRSGSVLGTAAMIDGMIERMEEELGCPTTVIATGGIARHILPLCKHEIVYDRDLMIHGLAKIYRLNHSKRV